MYRACCDWGLNTGLTGRNANHYTICNSRLNIVRRVYNGITLAFTLLDSGTSKDNSLLVRQRFTSPGKYKNNPNLCRYNLFQTKKACFCNSN